MELQINLTSLEGVELNHQKVPLFNNFQSENELIGEAEILPTGVAKITLIEGKELERLMKNSKLGVFEVGLSGVGYRVGSKITDFSITSASLKIKPNK